MNNENQIKTQFNRKKTITQKWILLEANEITIIKRNKEKGMRARERWQKNHHHLQCFSSVRLLVSDRSSIVCADIFLVLMGLDGGESPNHLAFFFFFSFFVVVVAC